MKRPASKSALQPWCTLTIAYQFTDKRFTKTVIINNVSIFETYNYSSVPVSGSYIMSFSIIFFSKSNLEVYTINYCCCCFGVFFKESITHKNINIYAK